MKYGLTETTVEKICAVFARFPEIEKAILYGSRAKGNFKTGSDIDLTLCGEALTSDLRSTIASALDDLLLPYTIDLSVFDELNNEKLREHIERVGVLFYERANQGAAIKKGWQIRKLGDLLEVQNGYAFNSKAFNPSKGMPLIRIRSLKAGTETETRFAGNYDDKYVVKAGDLLIGMDGEFGCYEWKGNPALLNQRVCRLQGFTSGIVPRFLFYGVNSHLKAIEDVTGYATVKHLSSKQILGIVFPLPPLPEQQRIVGILDEAFEGIATAKANAEKNLQNARALFESHLQSVFTQRGKGWQMVRIDEVTELARGHNPPKSKFSREAKPGYVRFYQIRDGGTDDYVVYVPDTPQLHKMKKDDIMMVAYRHIGRAFRGVEGAFNVALCKISNARRDLLDDDYLFHLIPSRFVKGELLKRSERSLIPSMSIEHLRELRIPLPPLREQQCIVERIKSLSAETQRLEAIYKQKLAALKALKKSLLHQAFSGHL